MRGKIKIKNCPTFKEETKLWRKGYEFVVGLDEVGRGPLAGPVCAAAICVFKKTQIAAAKFKVRNSTLRLRSGQELKIFDGIRDSKKLTAKQRERWHKVLINNPEIKWGVGIVSEKIIDKINILQATKLAMRRAITNLKIEPDYLLLDGSFLLEDLLISQKSIIRGDEQVFSCAAASIVAKVTRDRLMCKYHKRFPQYGFDRHKGYGTKRHFEKIQKHGPCKIHRLSFAPFVVN